MTAADDLLVCSTCATQFDVPATEPLDGCKICDDPRQYVPPEGQQWTSIASVKRRCQNTRTQDPDDTRLWSIAIEPVFGIGQRAMLLETAHGNVLWDMVALLDHETIEFINAKGGLTAIVISHPHYYATHVEWATTFNCPVYVSRDDEQWLSRADPHGLRRFIEGPTETIVPGVTAIKTGGHFDGSLVLHWENHLFTADTFAPAPSGLYHVNRPAGTTSFMFMWSYPNRIPLRPEAIHQIWKAIEPYPFTAAHGAFDSMDIRDERVKARILQSMQVVVAAAGHDDHPIHAETAP